MSSITFPAQFDAHPIAVAPSVSVRGSRFLRYLLIGLDAFALTVAWTIAVLLASTGTRSGAASVGSEIALIAGSVAFFDVIGLHRSRVCTVRVLEYERLARGCLGIALLALAVGAVTAAMPTPGEIVLGASLAFLFVIATRSWYRAWLTNRRRMGDYLRPVLIVGAGAEAAGIAALLIEHPELGYRTAAVAGDELEARRNGLDEYWYTDLDGARHALAELQIGGAIICASDLGTTRLNQTVQQLLDAGTHMQLSSGLHGIDVGRLRPSPLAHEPLFYVEHVTLAPWQLATKRGIDLLLASLLLIVTSPLLALAAIGIKFQDHGPVLFKQSRIGRGGEPFVLHKLRTMREGADRESAALFELNARDGPLVKIRDDPRVTVFGRVLRATSIDELPQLWNVLNGTMSLVGPRPALPDEVVHFDAELRARESVLPGITGLWQVEGRDNPSFAAYRRFDLFYLQNWTVALDLMILLGTVESVLTRVFRGLVNPGEDISLAPPEVKDPAAQARRVLEASVHGIGRGR